MNSEKLLTTALFFVFMTACSLNVPSAEQRSATTINRENQASNQLLQQLENLNITVRLIVERKVGNITYAHVIYSEELYEVNDETWDSVQQLLLKTVPTADFYLITMLGNTSRDFLPSSFTLALKNECLRLNDTNKEGCHYSNGYYGDKQQWLGEDIAPSLGPIRILDLSKEELDYMMFRIFKLTRTINEFVGTESNVTGSFQQITRNATIVFSYAPANENARMKVTLYNTKGSTYVAESEISGIGFSKFNLGFFNSYEPGQYYIKVEASDIKDWDITVEEIRTGYLEQDIEETKRTKPIEVIRCLDGSTTASVENCPRVVSQQSVQELPQKDTAIVRAKVVAFRINSINYINVLGEVENAGNLLVQNYEAKIVISCYDASGKLVGSASIFAPTDLKPKGKLSFETSIEPYVAAKDVKTCTAEGVYDPV